MNTNIVTREDINFLAQQPTGNLNMILAGMTALLNDNDTKVEMLENQTWFQRMCRTVSGKNKMTQQEIQKNHDKINAYMTQAMTELYEQQCIDRQIMMSLGNQLNELYAEHLQLKQMLGSFVAKLNEKIESVDNFHMLSTEIEQGVYSGNSPLVSVCQILSQMDNRCVVDARKMGIIQRSMVNQNILNNNEVALREYLLSIAEIPMDEMGALYIELGTIRDNFMANIIMNTMENYHFLSDMSRKLKSKKSVVDAVIKAEGLDSDVTLSINDIYAELLNSKVDMVNGLLPIAEIQFAAKSIEAEKLFITYELDHAYEIIHTLAEKGHGRAMYIMGLFYSECACGPVKLDSEQSEHWFYKGYEANDTLAAVRYACLLEEGALEQKEIFKQNISKLVDMAYSGDLFAQYELSLLYEQGKGVELNEDKQLDYLLNSANNGNWLSIRSLMNYYLDNENQQWEKWAEIGVDMGIPRALVVKGMDYLENDNFDAGIKLIREAADQGYAMAETLMGGIYLEGCGVDQDEYLAYEWFMKAAKQGEDDAQNEIGELYYHGTGVEQSYDKAAEWYRLAAEQGNADAQYNLAYCNFHHFWGNSGYFDSDHYIEEAKKWYKKAADQGHEGAIEERNKNATRLMDVDEMTMDDLLADDFAERSRRLVRNAEDALGDIFDAFRN